MPSDAEIKAKFWKALKSDRTLMLGLDGVEDGHARPMTAQFENDRSPIWFFASTDNELVKSLPRRDLCHRDLRLQRPRPVRHAARHAQSRQRPRDHRPVLEPLRRRLVRGRQRRPEAGAVAPGRGSRRDLARRMEFSLPVSSSCSAQIPKKNTRTKSPKSAFADAPARPGAGPLSR